MRTGAIIAVVMFSVWGFMAWSCMRLPELPDKVSHREVTLNSYLDTHNLMIALSRGEANNLKRRLGEIDLEIASMTADRDAVQALVASGMPIRAAIDKVESERIEKHMQNIISHIE